MFSEFNEKRVSEKSQRLLYIAESPVTSYARLAIRDLLWPFIYPSEY